FRSGPHAVELFDVRRRARPHPRPSARGRRPEAAVEARPQHVSRNPERDHFRLAVSRAAGVLMKRVSHASSPHPAARRPPSPASGEGNRRQSGQVMIIVAVWLVALIGSAALILLTGSVEWQRNQLQQLADQAALDSALKIGVGCSAGSAGTVITEADNFLATQRTRTGALAIGAGSCAAGYTGTDTFAGGL